VTVRFVVFVAALMALGAGAAQAQSYEVRSAHGETSVFHSIYVYPGQEIDGDLNVVFGDAHVAGLVRGDCNAIFGTCETEGDGRITGEVNSVTNDSVRAFVPWARHDASPFAEQDHRLFVKIASSAIVVLIFLLFPLRMRIALDRVERHPALSAATGTVAVLAVIPIAIALLLTIVGIPLIALEVAALFVGIWIGTGAIALLVGRRLCETVMPATTPSPLAALIVGLVVVSAGEIVPYVGWAVSALVWLAGLGAAILSFIRAPYVDAAVHRSAAGGPLGGPPMTRR